MWPNPSIERTCSRQASRCLRPPLMSNVRSQGSIDIWQLSRSRHFVPALDFERSNAVRTSAVGFQMAFNSNDLASSTPATAHSLLQNFYVEQLANDLMMHLLVECRPLACARLSSRASGAVRHPPQCAGRQSVGNARLHAHRSKWRVVAHWSNLAAIERHSMSRLAGT